MKLTFLILFLFSCSHYEAGDDSIPFKFGPLAKGCPDTNYPDWEKSLYYLPFPAGKTYMIGLSNCSGSYHSKGRPDQFAIDFDMDIGEGITATRAGKVVYVEESGIDYKHPNNLIVIDHGDGTFGQYMHLTKNGAIVEVGQKIRREQLIGYSGATGLAGYPHLHFVVTKIDYKWPYESIPVTFRNTISNKKGLKSRTEYTAY